MFLDPCIVRACRHNKDLREKKLEFCPKFWSPVMPLQDRLGLSGDYKKSMKSSKRNICITSSHIYIYKFSNHVLGQDRFAVAERRTKTLS